jgi:hypothetical protein
MVSEDVMERNTFWFCSWKEWIVSWRSIERMSRQPASNQRTLSRDEWTQVRKWLWKCRGRTVGTILYCQTSRDGPVHVHESIQLRALYGNGKDHFSRCCTILCLDGLTSDSICGYLVALRLRGVLCWKLLFFLCEKGRPPDFYISPNSSVPNSFIPGI